LVATVGPIGTAVITATAAGKVSNPVSITVVPGIATTLQKSSDIPVSPVAGSTTPIGVRITDAYGNGVPGIGVTFAAVTGGGAVTPTTATTDASGVGSTSFKVGDAVGANSATATASVIAGQPITFSATSVAGPAAIVAKLTPDPPTVIAGAPFYDSVRVQVTDALGNPKTGVAVEFAVVAGGGSVTPGTAITDGIGKAAAKFVTGVTLGTNRASATVLGIAPLTFSSSTIPASVTMTPDSVSLIIGLGGLLVAKAFDANAGQIQTPSFSWSSSQPSIIGAGTGSVDGSNAIFPARIGIAVVTATSSGMSASARVVVMPLTLSNVDLASATLNVGQTTQASITDIGNLGARPRVWGTTNPNVALVNDAGLVSAIGSGSACITVTVGGGSRCANLSVVGLPSSAPVASLILTAPSTTLSSGTSTLATAVYRDASNAVVSGAGVTWGSHNPAVAIVTDAGEIIALSPGNATISATANGVNTQIFFTVVN
jgi:hypothetical protein